MCSDVWATLRVDVGNDLDIVFGVEPFEVIPNRLGMRYSAWDAIAKLRLKLTRRRVSRRSRISFIIHRFLPHGNETAMLRECTALGASANGRSCPSKAD